MRPKLSLLLAFLFVASSAYAQRTGPGGRGPSKEAEEKSSQDGPSGDADFDCKTVKPGTKLKMNFEKEDILAVTEWISKYTCKNFIISEKVKGGKITIMSPTEVTVKEAYRAFEVALAANGIALVPSGKFLHVVEDKTKGAAFSISEAGSIPGGDNIVTQLFPIENGDATEMSKVMEKFKTDSGDIAIYPATNLMIVTDHASAIRRMHKILEQIDRPGLGEQVYVVEVRYAKASDLASMISDVFQQTRGSGNSPGATPVPARGRGSSRGGANNNVEVATENESWSADVKLSKVIADERTNQLIIVASKSSYEKVLYLLEKLDVEVPGSDAIHVIRLQNANAADLASVLSSLSKGGSSAAGRPPTPGGRGNRGPQAQPAPQGGEAGELFSGDVQVTADEATNALVVVASKSDYEVLSRVVKMLDIPRRQVFIEAMIFEVSLTKDNTFGISFHGGLPLGDPPNGLIFGGHQDASLSSLVPALLPTLTLGAIGGEPINIGGVNIPPVGIILNALATDSEANILSTPTLLATDNEEAEITVGQNIPVPTNAGLGNLLGGVGGAGAIDPNLGNLGALAGLAGGFGAFLPQITRQDIGVTLNVTPQINEGDFVTLKINQEITAIQSVDANGPTLSNRRATTTVTVKDQQTVVIGGLMEDRTTTTVNKVPILGDIPVLGYLFRHQTKLKSKTNLIIVLTPHIIKDQSDFRRILEQKLEERRKFIEQFTSGNDAALDIDLDYRRKKGALDEIRTTIENAEREEAEKAAIKPADVIIMAPENNPSGENSAEAPAAEVPGDVPASPEGQSEKLDLDNPEKN